MAHLVPTFLRQGGGATDCELVIFPTAMDDETLSNPEYGALVAQPWLDAGLPAACISVLHTRDRDTADSEEFTAALETATAVWFDGGRQWRFVDAYSGTKTLEKVRGVLDRGGVVGGSSAGATVLGEFLTRGDTESNQLLIGDHTEGFGLMKNVAIDQHLLRRNRMFDLLEVLTMQPELLGLGIDEGTAIIVRDERADVIGQSYVAVYNSAEFYAEAGDEAARDPFFLLGHGQALDLVTRLPVGGSAAEFLEDQLMLAILSDTELVVAIRQQGFQQLMIQLQGDPQGTMEAYRESAPAMAFIRRLSAGIEQVRAVQQGGDGAKL